MYLPYFTENIWPLVPFIYCFAFSMFVLLLLFFSILQFKLFLLLCSFKDGLTWLYYVCDLSAGILISRRPKVDYTHLPGHVFLIYCCCWPHRGEERIFFITFCWLTFAIRKENERMEGIIEEETYAQPGDGSPCVLCSLHKVNTEYRYLMKIDLYLLIKLNITLIILVFF